MIPTLPDDQECEIVAPVCSKFHSFNHETKSSDFTLIKTDLSLDHLGQIGLSKWVLPPF